MQKRICGREQEFGIRFSPKILANSRFDNLYYPDSFFSSFSPSPFDPAYYGHPEDESKQIINLIIEIIAKNGLSISGKQYGRPQWLVNGGVAYLDYLSLEYASAECLAGSLDVIKQEKASELIISEAVQEFLMENKLGIRKLAFYKGNADPYPGKGFELCGAHQNYSCLTDKRRTVFALLRNFLPATLPFSGSGYIYQSVKGKFSFILSERTLYLKFLKSVGCQQHELGLLNERDEPLIDEELSGLSRLHIVSRDATRCELQTWLIDTMTHLVIRLAEEGWELPDQYNLTDPIRELRLINFGLENGLSHKVRCGNSREGVQEINLWQYNQIFLDAAKQLRPLSDAERKCLEKWQEILNLLRAMALEKLSRKLDWATKKAALEMEMKRFNFDLNSPRAFKFHLDYQNISPSPRQSLFARLVEEGRVELLVDAEQIQKAKTAPPHNTRAKSRSEFIKFCHRNPKMKKLIWDLRWNLVSLTDGDLKSDLCFGKPDNPFSTAIPNLSQTPS